MEFGAEFFFEAAGLGEAVELFKLEVEVKIHVVPIVGEVRGEAVFRVTHGQGAAAHGVEEKGLIGRIAGDPEGAVLGEDEFAHAEGSSEEVLVDPLRRVEFLELIEFAEDAGAFLQEDEQDFLNGEEEDFRVGAFGAANVVDLAVNIPNALAAESVTPVSRGVEKFQNAGHHPARAPLGQGFAVEVKGVGEIGFGIVGVHDGRWLGQREESYERSGCDLVSGRLRVATAEGSRRAWRISL